MGIFLLPQIDNILGYFRQTIECDNRQ